MLHDMISISKFNPQRTFPVALWVFVLVLLLMFIFPGAQVTLAQELTSEVLNTHVHHHASGSNLDLITLFVSAARIIYFLTLLLVTGWVVWGILHPIDPLAPLHTHIRKISFQLRGYFLLTVTCMIGLQLRDVVDLTQPYELHAFVTDTTVGLSWTVSLLLAVLSFIFLYRYRWLDVLWVSLLWFAETLNGHALATEPVYLSAVLNFIHLAGASLWAGGLLYILLLRRVDRPMLYRFLPSFSMTALWTLLVLLITGVTFTLYVLPDLRLLWQTEWGIYLLVKSGLVLLVFIVSILIRRRIHARTEDRLHALFKFDFVLMLAIVAMVGLFTHISPEPPTEPMFYHDVQGDTHLVLKITPNATEETNQVYVEVWLPSDKEAPELVTLSMHYIDGEDIPPIEVPLRFSHEESDDSSPDFIRYSYTSDGPYLPFPGEWEAQVRIKQLHKQEVLFRYSFANVAL